MAFHLELRPGDHGTSLAKIALPEKYPGRKLGENPESIWVLVRPKQIRELSIRAYKYLVQSETIEPDSDKVWHVLGSA